MAGLLYLIRIRELELPGIPGPGDEGGAGLVREELQQELPQLDRSGSLQKSKFNILLQIYYYYI